MSINAFSPAHMALLLVTAGLIVYLFSLWRIVRKKTSPAQLQNIRRPIVRFAVAYSIYFVAVCVLANGGFFRVVTMPPRFLIIFLPMLLSVVSLTSAKPISTLSFLSAIPPVALIVVQSFRILIELLLVQFLNEKLIPVEMSLHGRNFDVLVGILALPTAYLFWRKYSFARAAGLAFNVIGLISLLNIFSIVIPSLPSPFQQYETLYLPTYFPGVMIVFVATMAIYLHILSLKQLLAFGKKELQRIPIRNETNLKTAETRIAILQTEKPAQ